MKSPAPGEAQGFSGAGYARRELLDGLGCLVRDELTPGPLVAVQTARRTQAREQRGDDGGETSGLGGHLALDREGEGLLDAEIVRLFGTVADAEGVVVCHG